MADIELVIKIPEEDYKFIKDLRFYHSGRRSGRTIERNVINAIKNGKPYEEKPQGEWINLGEEIGAMFLTYTRYRCSLCGYETSLIIPRNFCPDCGAKMKKGGADMRVKEEAEKIEVEEPITLTDEQITEMWESGYISDKEEEDA